MLVYPRVYIELANDGGALNAVMMFDDFWWCLMMFDMLMFKNDWSLITRCFIANANSECPFVLAPLPWPCWVWHETVTMTHPGWVKLRHAERHLWLVPNMQRARCTGSWRGLRPSVLHGSSHVWLSSGFNWWSTKTHRYEHEMIKTITCLKKCKCWPHFIVTSGMSVWSCFGGTSSFTLLCKRLWLSPTHPSENRLWKLNQQPNQC